MATPTTPIPTTSLDIILDTPKSSKKSNIWCAVIAILAVLTLFGVVLLLTLLAIDVITIPYLTPFAHFVALVISPIVPLLFPLFLGIFLKVCQHKTWPNKKTWVCITGAWLIQHVQRAGTDLYTLMSKDEMCGLKECTGKWVEWFLVCVVVGGQIAGAKWDAGYVDMWLERVIEEERKKAAVIAEKAMEKGEVPAGSDLEKAQVSECVVYKSAEEEKRELMQADAIVAEKEASIAVDEEKS